MDESNKITRRKVIGGIGASIATLAISPVFAGKEKSHSKPLTMLKL
ncbi:MAG: hypothetical protein M3Z26_13695 [Bacteroidota bacterium]|nr:hypothetical protein [Bacteroidota bacterium]